MILILPVTLLSQERLFPKTDVSAKWQVYNSSSKSYGDLAPKEKSTSLRLTLAAHQYKDAFVEIISIDRPILLVNGKLVGVVYDTLLFDPAEFEFVRQGPLELTLYNKSGIRSNVLKTTLIQKSSVKADLHPIFDRTITSFTNNFILISLIILAMLAFLVNKFPKDSRSFSLLLNSFSMINKEEALISSRPMARNNLLFIFFSALLLGFILVALKSLIPEYFSIQLFERPSLLVQWFLVSLLIFGLIIGKYALIVLFGELFVLREFRNIQFFNGLRINLGGSFIFIVIIIFTYLTYHSEPVLVYTGVLYGFVILILLKMLILFFKLLNYSRYRVFHLILYLCATEVFPFLLLYKIVLG